MKKKLRAAIVLIGLMTVLTLVSCTNSGIDSSDTNGVNNTLHKPAWIDSAAGIGTINIALDTVRENVMTHFKVNFDSGDETFMAYLYRSNLYVRANRCVPCGSFNFALKGNELICLSCGTIFTADTGAGVSGGCKDFPKAAVDYRTDSGQVVMDLGDLQQAYEDTLQPG